MTAPLQPRASFAAVYAEPRRLAAARLARESDVHTLDATALVHEAYLRLAGSPGFESNSQYVCAAAEAMRRILVDHARKKRGPTSGAGAGCGSTWPRATGSPSPTRTRCWPSTKP